MIAHRRCRHCGQEYSYEDDSANIMTFCPHCHRYDHLECEYGYGGIVPCQVLLGDQPLAVIRKSGEHYRLDSLQLNIHEDLYHTGIKALEEAEKRITQALPVKIVESVEK